MAIRNIDAINSALSIAEQKKRDEVEMAKFAFQLQQKNILSHSTDIKDAIDTFNYLKGKGANIYRFSAIRIKNIGFKDGFLWMQFNDWKSENTGPYNWFCFTDGENVFIQVNSAYENVTNMVNQMYRHDAETIIAPITDERGWHTCHSHTRPLDALTTFANKLPSFLEWFFAESVKG